ncbi:MAG: hypothetical protein IJP13_06205 [Lachnospiraceae bacterium]|nr:hypothetical protein [Lachnospiraceae bacterium]
MALQDDLRAQLIKQFAADVVEVTEAPDKVYYACPTCKRPVSRGNDKCTSCGQALNWSSISKEEYARVGMKMATLSFEVPGDFAKSDCRKCPLSYITKREGQNMYDCPLNMRNKCPLEFKEA